MGGGNFCMYFSTASGLKNKNSWVPKKNKKMLFLHFSTSLNCFKLNQIWKFQNF